MKNRTLLRVRNIRNVRSLHKLLHDNLEIFQSFYWEDNVSPKGFVSVRFALCILLFVLEVFFSNCTHTHARTHTHTHTQIISRWLYFHFWHFCRFGKVSIRSTPFWPLFRSIAISCGCLLFFTTGSERTSHKWLSSTPSETMPETSHFSLCWSITRAPWQKSVEDFASPDSWL